MYEFYDKRGVTTVELIEVITTKENLNRAYNVKPHFISGDFRRLF